MVQGWFKEFLRRMETKRLNNGAASFAASWSNQIIGRRLLQWLEDTGTSQATRQIASSSRMQTLEVSLGSLAPDGVRVSPASRQVVALWPKSQAGSGTARERSEWCRPVWRPRVHPQSRSDVDP